MRFEWVFWEYGFVFGSWGFAERSSSELLHSIREASNINKSICFSRQDGFDSSARVCSAMQGHNNVKWVSGHRLLYLYKGSLQDAIPLPQHPDPEEHFKSQIRKPHPRDPAKPSTP